MATCHVCHRRWRTLPDETQDHPCPNGCDMSNNPVTDPEADRLEELAGAARDLRYAVQNGTQRDVNDCVADVHSAMNVCELSKVTQQLLSDALFIVGHQSAMVSTPKGRRGLMVFVGAMERLIEAEGEAV